MLANTDGKQIGSLSLSDAKREFVAVKPGEVHTVLNTYDQECELLIICSEEYDPDSPDTIVYKKVG